MADWIDVPNYLPECGIPDCIKREGTITEQEFYDTFTEDTYLVAIYSHMQNGGISANFPWNDGVPPSCEDLQALWDASHPDGPVPLYGWNGVRDTGAILSCSPVVADGSYTGFPCGTMTPGFTVINNGDSWTASAEAYTTRYYYKSCPNFECPPNTHLEDGYCVPNEGWEWCDDSHTSACPHCYTLGCLEATDGSANPDCYDVGATFEVCLQWIPYDPNCNPTSEMDYFDVPIMYEGSLANSISGPDELRIDIQDNSTGCITLSVNSSIQEGGTLSIVPTNQVLCDPNQTAIVLELCTVNTTITIPGTTNPNDEGNVLGIVDCSGGGGGGGGTGPNGEVYGPEDCCSYMPKDYLVWKEGIGLAETIPPYMKSFFINNE